MTHPSRSAALGGSRKLVIVRSAFAKFCAAPPTIVLITAAVCSYAGASPVRSMLILDAQLVSIRLQASDFARSAEPSLGPDTRSTAILRCSAIRSLAEIQRCTLCSPVGGATPAACLISGLIASVAASARGRPVEVFSIHFMEP